MRHRRKDGIATTGTTRVLDCCEFPWTEVDGCRIAGIPTGAHEVCVAEMQRVAMVQRIQLEIDTDPVSASSGVYPLVVTVTVKT